MATSSTTPRLTTGERSGGSFDGGSGAGQISSGKTVGGDSLRASPDLTEGVDYYKPTSTAYLPAYINDKMVMREIRPNRFEATSEYLTDDNTLQQIGISYCRERSTRRCCSPHALSGAPAILPWGQTTMGTRMERWIIIHGQEDFIRLDPQHDFALPITDGAEDRHHAEQHPQVQGQPQRLGPAETQIVSHTKGHQAGGRPFVERL